MIIQGNNLVVNGTSVDGTKLTNHDKITVDGVGSTLYPNASTVKFGDADILDRTGANGADRLRITIAPPSHTGNEWDFVTHDDTSSAYLQIGYGLMSGTGPSMTKSALKLKHEGYVLMPNQPAWYGAQASPANQRGDVTLTQYGARGGMAVSSSSRVTVPVAGYYLVSWTSHTYNDYTDYIGIFKNGGALVYSYVNNGHAWNNICLSTVVELAANDYVTFRTIGSSGTYTTDVGVWSAMHVHLLG